MATLRSEISVCEDALFSSLGREGVILHLETGTYYEMDEVGTRMFSLLTQHGRVNLAYQALLDEYDVAEDRLQQELLNFVDELASHGLVQVVER